MSEQNTEQSSVATKRGGHNTIYGALVVVILGLLIIGMSNWQVKVPSMQNFNSNPENGTLEPDQSQGQTPDTSNWQTYANKKLGFSFQYPAEFTLVENVKSLPYLDQDADVALIENTKDGTVGDMLTFKMVKNTIGKAVADNLESRMVSMQYSGLPSHEFDSNYSAYVMSYNLSSANDIKRTYLIFQNDLVPGEDPREKMMEIMVAKTEAGVANPLQTVTLGDQIIGTVKFGNK